MDHHQQSVTNQKQSKKALKKTSYADSDGWKAISSMTRGLPLAITKVSPRTAATYVARRAGTSLTRAPRVPDTQYAILQIYAAAVELAEMLAQLKKRSREVAASKSASAIIRHAASTKHVLKMKMNEGMVQLEAAGRVLAEDAAAAIKMEEDKSPHLDFTREPRPLRSIRERSTLSMVEALIPRLESAQSAAAKEALPALEQYRDELHEERRKEIRKQSE